MKQMERKTYHKHGFLLQKKIGKKWVDWKGVANSKETILEMGGNPDMWYKVVAGFEIDMEDKKYELKK